LAGTAATAAHTLATTRFRFGNAETYPATNSTAAISAFDRVPAAMPFDRAALILDDPIEGDFKVLRIAGPVPLPPDIPRETAWARSRARISIDKLQYLLTNSWPLWSGSTSETPLV
jgi:hypothetical protein